MKGTRRILYVDMAPSVGGSVISLYYLVKGLDPSQYDPIVVLRASNPYVSRFRDLGVTVRTLSSDCKAPGYTQDAVDWARRGRLTGWLKQRRAGEGLVHLLGFYARSYPRLRREASELKRIMGQVQPDLVHLNDYVGVSRAGIMAARAARVPAICHLRAMDSRIHFDRWISRSLRGYICISHAVEQYQRTLGGRIGPTWVVYNGVDLADMVPAVAPAQIRGKLGLSPDHFVAGCIGRLVAWKGQTVFIHALARLASRWPRLHGLIVGGVERHATQYADELNALTRELGLADRIVFAGYRDDVPDVLAAMDVMVHASTSPEPFGRVLIEGMAVGTPVIGTDSGAVPEIVAHGVNGLLVPPGDPEAMAGAIERIIGDPELQHRLAGAGRGTVEQRFTMQHYVLGVQRVYEELLH